MDETKQIYDNVMDKITKAISDANTELEAIDPTGEKYILTAIFSVGVSVNDPMAESGSSTIHHEICISSYRANIAEVAFVLGRTANAVADYPHPEGFAPLDVFARSHDFASAPEGRLSVN
ncbi:MAG: hypothetical protein WDA22_10820 [Bacteroidota bacterium]